MHDINSNRDLLEKIAYPEDALPNCRDLYILFRKQKEKLEILLCGCDISDIDNKKHILNRLNDGWEYGYLTSDLIEKDFDIKI